MKQNSKSLLAILFFQSLLLTFSAEAQNIDSLIEVRATTSDIRELYQIDMAIAKAALSKRALDLAHTYIDKAIEEVQGLDNREFKYETYFLAGRIYFEDGKYLQADSLYTITLQYAQDNQQFIDLYETKFGSQLRLGDFQGMKLTLSKRREYIGNDTVSLSMARYYLSYGVYYLSNNDFLKTLDYSLKAKKLYKQLDRPFYRVNHNIALTYSLLGAYDNAIDTEMEVFQAVKAKKDYSLQLLSLYTFMYTYLNLGDYERTQKYCFQAIELNKKRNVSEVFGVTYYILGMTHLRQNQLDSAEYYFQLGIDISLKQREAEVLGTNYFGMSELRLLQGDIQTAKEYAEKIEQVLVFFKMEFDEYAAILYAKEGNYKKAYNKMLDNWLTWKTKEGDRSNYKSISRLLNDKYENEKKAASLEKANAIRIRNLIGMGLGTVLLLVLGWSITISRNNKKRKQLNELLQTKNDELQALDEIKTRFFANISHEFKTPLTLILNPIRRLLRNGELNEEAQFLAKSAEKNSLQLLELTNQVLELTKFEVDKVDNHPIVFNLSQTVKKLYADFESLAVSQNIDFQKQVHISDDLNVKMDYTKFTTIIKNLISNAIKFTPANGQVIYNITEQADNIEIRVADTGRGIHPSDLPYIFDRYYQAKTTKHIQEGGTGIGLAICSEYTKLLGGSLTVQSEYEKGTKFTLLLPKVIAETEALPNTIFEETKTSNALPISSIPTTNKKLPTVLIAEDNLDMQNYLQIALKDYYQIEMAANGKAALQILKEKTEDIQLIISDVMMPEMNGYELLTHLKKNPNYASIPTIMLTALSGTDDKLKALRIGIDDYLTKPFIDEELLARIDNLLQNREERTAFKAHIEKEVVEPEIEKIQHTKEDQEWLERLEKYIHSNLKYSITTDLIAAHLHISRTKLYKNVKRIVGLTPTQYINEIRYQTARRLIDEHNNWTIKAIAAQVGFKDEKNFSRNFKRKFGKYPSELLE